MARHKFDAEDQQQSANRLRLEYEERERQRMAYEEELRQRDRDRDAERHRQEMKSAYDHTVGQPGKILQDMATRELRREIKQDSIGAAAHETYLAASVAAGVMVSMALTVAAIATEASYNNKLRDADTYIDQQFHKDVDRRTAELETQQATTLSDYKVRLENERQMFSDMKQAYTVEYNYVRDEAVKTIASADRRFEHEKNMIQKEQDAYDAAFKKEKEAINARLATTTDAAEIESLHKQMDAATNRHNAETKALTDRFAEAETKHNTTINHQNDVIRQAQIKYNNELDTIRETATNAGRQVAEYQKRMDQRDPNANTIVATHTASEFFASRPSADPARFADSVQQIHNNVGRTLAMQLGNEKEVAILNRVEADKVAAAQAKKDGTVFTPTASKEDHAAANAIVQKYAGDIKTQKGMDATISNMSSAVKALNKQEQSIQQSLNTISTRMGAIDKQSIELKAHIKNISSIENILKTGMIATGNNPLEKVLDGKVEMRPITAAERQKFEAQIKTMGNMPTAVEKLKSLHNEKIELGNKAAQLNQKRSQIQSARLTTQNHLALLKSKQGTLLDIANKNAIVRGKVKIDKRTGQVIKEKGAGASKKAAQLEKKAGAVFQQSISKIGREMSRSVNKGNEIHSSLMKDARSLAQAANKYKLALAVGGVAMKVLATPAGMLVKSGANTFRLIGKTNLGQKIINSKIGKGVGKFGSVVGKGGKMIFGAGGKFIGGVLKAPAAIMSAPIKIMTMPQTMAKKLAKAGVRTVRKGATGVVKAGGKVLRFGVRNTLGRMKWFQKASGRLSLVRARLKSFAANLKMYNPVALLKRGLGAIVSAIGGAITTLIGWIVTALLYVVGFALAALFTILIILILFALMMSVIDAVVNFILSLSTANQMLVKTDPEYILNQTVIYRNTETEIYDRFYKFEDDKTIFPVTTDPMYYSASRSEIAKWFISLFTSKKDKLESYNGGAQQYIAAQPYEFNKNGTVKDENGSEKSFKYKNISKHMGEEMQEYHDAKINYYFFSDLQLNSDGTIKTTYVDGAPIYHLKSNAQPSKYEISNAKDALALVDALYTDDPDKMQKPEVLEYLAVGKAKQADKKQTNSLFWLTHRFIYNSGNKEEDIWYHAMKTGYTADSRVIDTTKQYVLSGSTYITAPLDTPLLCDNFKTITLTYDVTETQTVHTHGSDIGANVGTPSLNEYSLTWYNKSSATKYTCSKYHSNSFSGASTSGVKYLKTNYVKSDALTALRNKEKYPSYANTMYFFKMKTSEYYVTDYYGNFLGTIKLTSNKNSDVFDAVTKVKNGKGNTINMNKSYGTIDIDFFKMTYSSSNGYGFAVYGETGSSLYTLKAEDLKFDSYNSIIQPTVSKCEFVGPCNHTYEQEIKAEKPVTFEVCQGHIDLDVSMVVATHEDKDLFYDEAAKVDPQENEDWSKTLTRFTWDPRYDVAGWGGYVVHAYHPYEDWAKNSYLRDLATAKASAEFSYTMDENADITKISENVDNQLLSAEFKSIEQGTERIMLCGYVVDKQIYYTESYVSGEQKDIKSYKCNNGSTNLGTIYYVDLGIVDGVPTPAAPKSK